MQQIQRPPLTPFIYSLLLIFATPTSAGPEKVAFPSKYQSWVLYTTVDRADNKQVRHIYASPEAIKAAKAGKPLPSASVISMEVYRAKVDEKGLPLKDTKGRFIKAGLFGIFVMEKRTGWGAEYTEDLRNGEWEYARFTPERKPHQPANTKPCFECHKPYGGQDFVITLPELTGTPAPR